jgi:hypothetical protein
MAETRGRDGINVMCPHLPGDLDDFVDRVVPELQHRGLPQGRGRRRRPADDEHGEPIARSHC